MSLLQHSIGDSKSQDQHRFRKWREKTPSLDERGKKVTLQSEETKRCDSLGAIILINYHSPPSGPNESHKVHEIHPLPRFLRSYLVTVPGLKSMILLAVSSPNVVN